MYKDNKQSKNYRYERKIVVTSFTEQEIELLVKQHPSLLTQKYPSRFVNNIYFDSIDYINYYDNIDGVMDRCKVRIRWYGDLFGRIKNPTLELKLKKGLMGGKQLFLLRPFTLHKGFNMNTAIRVVEKSNLPPMLKNNLADLSPTLLNRYKRKYFETNDGRYRLTIDSEMNYYQIDHYNNMFLNCIKDYDHIVLEIKYSKNDDVDADRFSNYFPFRITKNSKYINGIESLMD
jgi:SPX domain protein involved in polyphosphate accumulation